MIDFPGKGVLRRVLLHVRCRRARCLFVLSSGRCGTTTLAKVLSLSDRMEAVHEPQPWLLAETKAAYQDYPLSPSRTRADFRRYAEGRKHLLDRALVRDHYYAECSNRLTYYAPMLAHYFPNARFIHLYRHPADVVRSAMRRGYYAAHPWDKWRIEPRYGEKAHDLWSQWDAFQKSCWYWQAVNDFILNATTPSLAKRMLSVSAEQLFQKDGQTAGRIFDWLQLPRPPDDELQAAVASPENVQGSGYFPRWTDWSGEQRRTLAAIAGATAARLDYDLADNATLTCA